jgi:glycosyltransferase involved in cell wall biosynthesis
VFNKLATTLFLEPFKLAHFYAGCFTDTVRGLKENGVKVTYTAAAHDVEVSRREHEKFGIDFARSYPHLVEPDLWKRYLGGYLAADVVICPSQSSARVMRSFGCQSVVVIPHGVRPVGRLAPLPRQFTVGYLGSCGIDKGVIYLLQAWKRLAYKDALLILAGRDSTSPFVQQMVKEHGGRSVWLMGWVAKVEDFYNKISLYVQPSVTEGFGIEVLEAAAHGRNVVCSKGAGAVDIIHNEGEEGFNGTCTFEPCNVEELVIRIDNMKRLSMKGDGDCMYDEATHQFWQRIAEKYTWDKIRQRYVEVWKGSLK